MNDLIYKLIERPKTAFILCGCVANLSLWAIGHIKSFSILWVLGFFVFTALSALSLSVYLMEIVEKKPRYKIYFQLLFYTLLIILYLALNTYKSVLDQKFFPRSLVMSVIVFFTMLLMMNLRVVVGYSFENIKMLWKRPK
ncbi:hypothetical protein KTI63_12405 [Acinetobacter guillouiae]|uniref:hypothetical protein n=1 Tax=Acinetobacter TaxID=469 RepID=UPI0021D0321B|nr:hypothetical protein [Acinetobacter guillouiae]MCU4493269.1 hypothetical protein [Acinetobacter guillouiae]